jgi:hypothetical protein
MECLNCKTDVPQTPKKRPKLYCSEKCRIEFFRKKKPMGKRGRPKKEVVEVKETEPQTAVSGLMDEVLKEASINNAKLGIEAMIAAIKAEKIPAHRDTSNGRKAWVFDQKKRIQELENQLK